MSDGGTGRLATADCYMSDMGIAHVNDPPTDLGGTIRFTQKQRLEFARRLIAERSSRFKHFDTHLFADPAWDIMLELFVAETENSEVPVTNLCYTSNVPDTTILRWIKLLCDQGLLVRHKDDVDKRRVLVHLSAHAREAMDLYVCEQLVAYAKLCAAQQHKRG